MDNSQCYSTVRSGRRSFLKKGLAAGAAGAGIAVLAGTSSVFAQSKGREVGSGSLSKGDAALLRFASSAKASPAATESSVWQSGGTASRSASISR